MTEIQKSAIPFQKFRDLWQVNDKEWMKHRKEEWSKLRKTAYKDESAKTIKYDGLFFLTGEEVPIDIFATHISYYIRFMYTPYTSAHEQKELFDTISQANEKARVITSIFSYSHISGQNMPWLREKIQWFLNGIIGPTYHKIEEPYGRGDMYTISPNPNVFCVSYCARAMNLLKGKLSYNYTVDFVDYFISALSNADNSDDRKNIRLDLLWTTVNNALAEPNEHSALAVELATNLKQKEQDINDNFAIHAYLDKPDAEDKD